LRNCFEKARRFGSGPFLLSKPVSLLRDTDLNHPAQEHCVTTPSIR